MGQKLLEILNIPYTGSGIMSSAIAINKHKSKELLKNFNIKLPKDLPIGRGEWRKNKSAITYRIKKTISYPLVVKPNNSGSKDNKDLYFLEINTIPGMTPTSLCPISAKSVGIDFSALLDHIIKLAKYDR